MTALKTDDLQPVILIVDDVPENLSVLHDTLANAGYMVVIATNGPDALVRAKNVQPNAILLDAMMPGMDGFEVCEKLKAEFLTRQIPVIFMTGLTETEYVVKGFQAGGVDYVTKPIKPDEVTARIKAHVSNSKLMSQATGVLDLIGQAVFTVNATRDEIVWQTPLARKLFEKYCHEDSDSTAKSRPPARLKLWLLELDSYNQLQESPSFSLSHGKDKVYFRPVRLVEDNQIMIALKEESIEGEIDNLISSFNLTKKEAEVLHWTIQGKASRDIGDILEISPRTVNKHLEHIFEKLGVDSRTAALAYVRSKI